MNGLHSLALAATLTGSLLFVGASANAQLLNGSLPLAGEIVTENGPNLLLSTTVSTATDFTSGAGVGDFASIPLSTLFNATPLVLADPLKFRISNPTWGTFIGLRNTIVSRTPSFYDAELIGVFSPGPGLPGKVPTGAELRISINQSGTSLAEAITLQASPLIVPEPSGIATLSCLSFAGACLLTRKRRIRK